ncbi:MAG: cellulose synthase subunit BcsC-related outer membrane protein [Terracidiphilus sp.]
MVTGCLVLALEVGLAQNAPRKPAVSSPEATRSILVDKAHALESRGRPDMAIQLWQQILLSDPKNSNALAGLARDLRLIGSDKAGEALERLRKLNPNDPNIPKIEALAGTRVESDQSRQAGELARQGKLDDAMRIYKQLYGDHPPDGDIALAYYQTMYGTASGKEAAVSAMRALARRNPGDPRFAVELGIMLTYESRSRAEGIRILQEHPRDSNAQTALRQALLWDSAHPASAAQLHAYLKEHPQDTELAGHLKENESKLAHMNSGIARTPAERAAFAALNAQCLDVAESRFKQILATDPKNGRAAAGMGLLRMQQKKFGDAIDFLTQAESDGFKAGRVVDALATSRFWYTMGQAADALDADQCTEAAERYRAALAMRPHAPEALNGLAGLLVKQEQFSAAAPLYEQLVKMQPNSMDAWRGLFLAYARDNQAAKAVAVTVRLPAPVRAALARDAEYLRALAAIYRAQNCNAEAQHVLAQAMSLPSPGNGTTLRADTRLEDAGILMKAKRYDQAAALYSQLLSEDAGNLSAWMGMISAHHELGQDNQAIADIQKMPPDAYEAALADPGFLSMLGAIYQQANQLEVAQGLLERSAKLQIAAGGQPGVALQLQLAGIYLLRNNTEQAYAIYRQVLIADPSRADAWKGLIAALLATNRNTEALEEIARIPAPVRKDLESDVEFLQTETSLYAASGDMVHAVEYMNRVESHYARLRTEPPASIAVQNAWLLFNTRNDRALYPALMRLGGRADLTREQRETVEDIWANWSVRRAAIAMDNGNIQRAVDILDAASQAFPENMTVRKAVAGGYVQVGRAKESLALYKTIPMQDATADDFQGAIGAALAANDKSQAELWLRQALERYPRDPVILLLAARYEQARGDNQRAADYYRASLAAMPPASPAERLAHVLVYPDQDTKTRRAVTAADLQRLLDPNCEPFAKTTKVPPLPAYGPDPYNGSAPVVLTPLHPPDQAPPQPAQPDAPWVNPPSANQGQPPPAPASNPQVFATPAAHMTNQQLFHQQSASRVLGRNPRLGKPASTARPRLLYASFQINTRDRMRLRPAQRNFARFQTASFVAGAGNSRRVSPRMLQASLVQAQVPHQSNGQPVQLSADAPHSLASDAWKGLVFSLMAGNRNAEALQEIRKIPPDVRKQLEADVEFEQAEASLYFSVGDMPHATEYLNQVENFYLLRRAAAPAGIEVQHAWLLYTIGDDPALYPVLLRLDARQDLTPAQREQVERLWASWAVRRAGIAMDNGSLLRGVQILQAACEEYPGNMNIRRALAGAYAKIGRPTDALALYKAIPMQDASAGDYQGAVATALAATDMAQAETWLRQALERFPGDAQILALAARFEQARGNAQRATDFWRASLAAMPPGATARRLDSGLVPQGSYKSPVPGNLKRLLDPRNDPPVKTASVPPPPSSSSNSLNRIASAPSLPPAAAPQQKPWLSAPSANPLPLPPPALSNPGAAAETKASSNPPKSSAGQTNLPPSEANIDSIGAESGGAPAQLQPRPPVHAPIPASQASNPGAGLRIAAQPMNSMAAQAQALFAEQTDGQLTQGSAAVIRALPNAPAGPLPKLNTAPSGLGQYTVAQYTPSAQEAATGAFSAPKQQTTPQAETTTQPQPAPAPAKPSAAQPATPATKKKKTGTAASKAIQQSAPTLQNAPAQENPQQPQQVQNPQPVQVPAEVQAPPQPATTDTGLTDEELQQRNLPPLRGPWVRVQRDLRPPSPRDEAEMQLRAIEAGYSPWLGGTGILNYRAGSLGYDRLAVLEAPFEVSMPLGFNARLTIVAKPVFLDSGQADGTSVITVRESTTAGSTLVSIPQPIGTLTATAVTPPAQQNAVGIGAEVQLAFPHLALAGGYTPAGFQVATFTGRAQWKPANGPFTLSFSRDPVRDTQLSYSGLRDPGSATLSFPGNIWGGVMANQGTVQYAHGDAESGFYLSAGGQYLAGHEVEINNRVEGSGGAYWRLKAMPEYGNLSIGANFFGMRYAHNEDALTYGMGGYFSPQAYFLANVPFTWVGHYGTRWHYDILGSLGVQAFQEDLAPLWPLAVDKALETAMNNAMLPARTSVGPNYDLRTDVAYQIGPHWFAGGFFGANNSRNYSAVSAGFFVRYLLRPQPSTAATPTGIFPTDGLRPFTVP